MGHVWYVLPIDCDINHTIMKVSLERSKPIDFDLLSCYDISMNATYGSYAWINNLIENCPSYCDLSDHNGRGVIVVGLHHDTALENYGSSFIGYFTDEPCYETDLYKWNTVRIDQVVNLKIWRK